MPYTEYILASGESLQKSERFTIRAVLIDNYTSQWLQINGARFAPPYTAGIIIALVGIGTVIIVPGRPGGGSQSAAVTGETATVTITDQPLAAAPGTYVGQPTRPQGFTAGVLVMPAGQAEADLSLVVGAANLPVVNGGYLFVAPSTNTGVVYFGATGQGVGLGIPISPGGGLFIAVVARRWGSGGIGTRYVISGTVAGDQLRVLLMETQ